MFTCAEWTCFSSTSEHLLWSFMHLLFLLMFHLVPFFKNAGSLPDKRLLSLQPEECRCALRLFWLQLQNAFVYWNLSNFPTLSFLGSYKTPQQSWYRGMLAVQYESLHGLTGVAECYMSVRGIAFEVWWASPDICTLRAPWGKLRIQQERLWAVPTLMRYLCLVPCGRSLCLALMECLETYCRLLLGDGKCN